MVRTDQFRESRIHGSSRRARLLALAMAPVLAVTFAFSAPAEARASHPLSHPVKVEPAYCDGLSNSISLATAAYDYTWVFLQRWDPSLRDWRVHRYGGGVYGYQFHGLSDGYYRSNGHFYRYFYRIRAIGLNSAGWHWAQPSYYRMAASVVGYTPTHQSYCQI